MCPTPSKKEATVSAPLTARIPPSASRLTARNSPRRRFDQFAKQIVPRCEFNDVAMQATYDALVQKVWPCVIIVHSQGGNFGFNAALYAPDKVKALIAIEPSGAPDASKIDASKMKAVPHLFVWGDFLDKNERWKKVVLAPRNYQTALAAKSGLAEVMELPKMGITGNST